MAVGDDERLAETHKIDGNSCYEQKDYKRAMVLYSSSIKLVPECAVYYCNRAAAYMKLEKYAEALRDAQQAISLDDQLVKGHLREAKCHLALGSVDAAIRALQRVIDLEPTINSRLNQEACSEMRDAKIVKDDDTASLEAFDEGDFEKVVLHMDNAIKLSPACARFKIRKAEALIELGRFSEGKEAVSASFNDSTEDADALYVRGLGLYYQGNYEKAVRFFQLAKSKSPDHSKAISAYMKCLDMRKKCIKCEEFLEWDQSEKAYEVYTQMLAIDPRQVFKNVFNNARTYCNRAILGAKLGRIDGAIEDCNKAIEIDENFLRTFRCRARCYMDLKKYEEAVSDYEKIFNTDGTQEKDLHNAKMKLEKSKVRNGHYKTLGLEKNCTKDEITKAYRKLAKVHHPDKNLEETDEVQKQEESMFKELQNAYDVLSDPAKKMEYDRVQDIEDMDGESGAGTDTEEKYCVIS